jgi:hypothetical protein
MLSEATALCSDGDISDSERQEIARIEAEFTS